MQNNYQPGDTVLNNWTLIRQLGQGSYGTVFEAHREDFGTTYKAAIKIITIPQNQGEIDNARAEGMNDESMTAYFRESVEEIVGEFALMARLKGTANVVNYEDHTVIPHETGIGWDIIIRMELLQPLFDFSKGNEFTRQDIIKLGMDICRGLELCQKYNIIHRDIKPENIMVSELGNYKLGDFGIARTVDKTTSALTKRGTYTYMAPEVFNTGVYGPSVDIYSLGVVMYRLLNDNRTPFLPDYPEPITPRDRDTALIKRMGGKNPMPPPKNADNGLAEIVLKACAHSPKKRFAEPMQMLQALEGLLQDNPIEPTELLVTPVSIPQKTTSLQKILPYIACGVLLVALLFVLFLRNNGPEGGPDYYMLAMLPIEPVPSPTPEYMQEPTPTVLPEYEEAPNPTEPPPAEPTAPAHPPFPGSLLSRTDESHNVRVIQEYLYTLSQTYAGIARPTINGRFGAGTMIAVMHVQEIMGLPITGVIDHNTWDAIISLSEQPPAQVTRRQLPAHYYVVTAVNLRTQPNTDSEVMVAIQGGTRVWVSHYRDNEWFAVSYNHHHGYMRGEFLLHRDFYEQYGFLFDRNN